MHSTWFSSTFVIFLKFSQMKEGGPNFLGEPILQNGWIIWSPLLYLYLRNLRNPNSSSFSRFQCILYDSAVLLSVFSNFPKLKRGDLISWENQFCKMAELFGPPFCISIWEIWGTQILRHSVDFNAFYMIQQYFWSVFLNFLKLKRRDLISWGNQFCRTAELFGPPFCISIWEIWGTQILRHSLPFNAFYMIQQYFCQFFKIFPN